MNKYRIRPMILLFTVLFLVGCQSVNQGFNGSLLGNAFSSGFVGETPPKADQVNQHQAILDDHVGTQDPQAPFKMSPENTTIAFVGSAGPMKQKGSFETFSGVFKASSDIQKAQLDIQIQMDSVKTKNWLLRKHLIGKDFFHIKQFPTAHFISKSISPTATRGLYLINGRLHLHGVDQDIEFPATIEVGVNKAYLKFDMVIRQSDFGMARAAKITKDEVPVTIEANLLYR
ncbi:MAG: YceI family protein [Planctomycetota bacterium]